MSPSKREREYARRRYEKYQRAKALQRARRRRNSIIAGSVVGLLVLGLGIAAVVANNDGSTPTASGSPTPTSTAPARVLPAASVAEGRTWTGTLALTTGDVAFTLDGAKAPQAVANFVTLAKDGFFDGTKCHRVTTKGIFVLQCGDPTATGNGGPGYTFGPIENAPKDGVYPAGTIAMARANTPDSMGSQFFLVYKDTTLPTTGGGYTVFGHITSGLGAVQAVADGGVKGGATDGAPSTDVIIQGVETK